MIYENYAFEAENIAASLRQLIHVLETALVDADNATIPVMFYINFLNIHSR